MKKSLILIPIVLVFLGASCDNYPPSNTLQTSAPVQHQQTNVVPNANQQLEKQDIQTSTVTKQSSTQTNTVVEQNTDGLSNDNYYVNSQGNTVHSPAYAVEENTIPAGASARCKDGTYSFSQNRRGTCSGHGGVSEWL